MYLGLCAYKQACVLYVLLIIVKTKCMPFFDCNIMVCIEKHNYKTSESFDETLWLLMYICTTMIPPL